MIFGDLLKFSKWMALGAIFLCSLATTIAYFSLDVLEGITVPLLVFGVFLWVLSVVWFLWGWLKNANDDSNEGKGVSASSYILAFLPICYCYLMATDESRTKVTVKVTNESGPVHSVKVFGSGSIFLNPDTLKVVGLAKGESLTYELKAATAPGMKGDVQMIFFRGKEKVVQKIAGPFSIQPMNLKQDWKFVITESK